KQSGDFYVAGGKLPWWLSGVSHHVSGYSGVVFTGYAAIAYTEGFTIYAWWAFGISIAIFLGSDLIPPRWSRLRKRLKIMSPTEYLVIRYNLSTQQLIAWSGVVLKLFDCAGKWVAIGILLNGFTGIPINIGIIIAGAASIIYVTAGGLWADTANDFLQFIVQVVAGLAMFFIVIHHLGGFGSLTGIWKQLPPDHSQLFNGPYTLTFALAMFFIGFLSYNGGTWNLAARFIATPSGKDAKKAARLSASLFLLWPLILFFPMWAAPILLPDFGDPSKIYAGLTTTFLPVGLVGLVLASMFAATLSMTSSDANTISAVLSRDILPVILPKLKRSDGSTPLWLARLVTFLFTLTSITIALNNVHFGGVLGLIIKWFGGLVGLTAIPLVLGLVPFWKHAGPIAAWSCVISGLAAFIIVNFALAEASLATSITAPVLTSFIVFTTFEFAGRSKPAPKKAENLISVISTD
ncbi:MAG: Na+:solute symporter, partial [Bacteroidota bacterium]|nr:Na+:solute symporter [Bacteroidota bacterium]